MLTNGKQILQDARAKGYGVGAFNIGDAALVEIVLCASESLNTPVMLQIGDWTDPNAAESRRMSDFDAENFAAYLRARSAASPVPVIIHLDHCPTFEGCIRAIKYGATSVMIDASMKSFEENVAITNKVIEAAHACNVMVEAEIGHVTGHANSTGAVYTTPEQAKAFYDATHVDMLAVSIGTVHGVYTSKPALQYKLISELRDAIPVPLVMHGSSGLEPDEYRKCVANGICKINFATYLHMETAKAVAEAVKATKESDLRLGVLMGAAKKRGIEYVKEHIGYFGTRKFN
jgi:ketose-bisphosphate aldolase